MPRGGKRPGAGRPVGTVKPDSKKFISARIAPDLVEWLDRFEKTSKTKIIEAALRVAMETWKKNNW